MLGYIEVGLSLPITGLIALSAATVAAAVAAVAAVAAGAAGGRRPRRLASRVRSGSSSRGTGPCAAGRG